jgi:8-oxo-dGTP diphosphatase
MAGEPALPYKISTLIYVLNPSGEVLLLKRRKAPNAGLWSPIGGKLEMATGESPFEAARREAAEEIGLELEDADLHLFGMIAEKGYEDSGHWLMFLFVARVAITALPPAMEEGHFGFFPLDGVETLPIPETDRQALWPLFREFRDGFVSLRAECGTDRPLEVTVEQRLRARA